MQARLVSQAKKLGFAAVVALLLLGAIEVGLRVADMPKGRSFFDHQPAGHLIYVPHPFLGTTVRPNQFMNSFAGPVTVNANGLRGQALPLVPPPGVRRVACLGGSTVFGTALADGDTFPVRLEESLDQAQPGHWQVLNGGIPGWTSAENIIHLALTLSDYHLDYVFLYQGYNDLKAIGPNFASDYSHFKAAVVDAGWVHRWFGRFKTYRELRDLLMLSSPAQEIYQKWTGASRTTADARATFRRNVGHIVSLSQGLGAVPILSSFAMPIGDRELAARPDIRANLASAIPSLTLQAVRDGIALYNDEIRDVARERGVPFFDAAALLSQYPEYFADHCHFTPEGARVLAGALAPVLSSLDATRGARSSANPAPR